MKIYISIYFNKIHTFQITKTQDFTKIENSNTKYKFLRY